MRLLELARARPLLAGALLGAVAGTAIGLSLPIRASAPDPAEISAWTPLTRAAVARYDAAAFARVRDSRPWAGGASAAAGAVQWRLAGIIVDPVPTALVYGADKGKPIRLTVGATLPDGGTIVGISPRSVSFTRDGCPFERVLYSTGDQAGTAGCPSP